MRAALLLAAAVLLAGCSPGTPAAAPASGPARYHDIDALVTAVAQRQRADQTARLSLRGEVTGGATFQFTGEGVLRVVGDAVSVKFTQVVTQQGAAPQETGFVVLPDATYLKLPSAQSTAATPWVRVDPRGTDPGSHRLAALARTLTESADPTRTLSRYADATQITDASDDVVDGAPAVRYTIVVDLARAAGQQADPALRSQLQQQVRSGLTRVTSTLWVDAVGHPVRSSVRQDLPGIGTLAITGSYRDWGGPVEIDPPPATQVRATP